MQSAVPSYLLFYQVRVGHRNGSSNMPGSPEEITVVSPLSGHVLAEVYNEVYGQQKSSV